MGPQMVPTGIYGPLPPDTTGFILDRSNLTQKGIQVLLGVPDVHFNREIKVIIKTKSIIHLSPEDTIAQIVFLPYHSTGKNL